MPEEYEMNLFDFKNEVLELIYEYDCNYIKNSKSVIDEIKEMLKKIDPKETSIKCQNTK